MTSRVLVTGGAGFIGTHLTRRLILDGHEVVILDNFLPQVHGTNASLAPDLAPHVQLVVGDVADPLVLHTALDRVDSIVHLAAETGTGQSMYEVGRYAKTNLSGTAQLYEILTKNPRYRVERIVVASSRSIYGEGAYLCATDGLVYPLARTVQEKQAGQFDPVCPVCCGVCETYPTPESAPLQPSSFYGLTKQVQEQTVLMFGRVLNIPSFALRYQNVFGPGQSLQNPYTGILAIFSNLARTGQSIRVFEDGKESRDFVYVEDAVRATTACLVGNATGTHAVNVGSGVRTSVLEVASLINEFYGNRSPLQVTGDFRDGDIRHGAADLTNASKLLGYEPCWSFRDGLKHFLEWAGLSEPSVGKYQQSLDEMKRRGLMYESS